MKKYTESNNSQPRVLTCNSKASKQAPITAILQHYKNNIQRVRTPGKPEQTELIPEAKQIREKEESKDLKSTKIWAEAIFSNQKMYIKESFDGISVKARLVDSKVIFVLGTDNTIYIRREAHGIARQDEFTHANFLEGVPVKTAGQMFARNGVITRIDNESGHYRPRDITLEWIIDVLRDKVDLNKTMLVMLTPSNDYKVYNAFEYDTRSIEKLSPLDDSVRVKDEEFQMAYDSPSTICELPYLQDSHAYESNRPLIIKHLKSKGMCTLSFSFKKAEDTFPVIWPAVLHDINYTYLLGYSKIKVSAYTKREFQRITKYEVFLSF